MADLLREFLYEAEEHLTALDNDMLALERTPGDAATLASAFRAMHSIKGSCGFLKLQRLEKIARAGEHVMEHYRNNAQPIVPQAIALMLKLTDVMRAIGVHLAHYRTEPPERVPGDDDRLVDATQALVGQAQNQGRKTTAPPLAPVAATILKTETSSVRLSVDRLEELMDLMAELILARNDLLHAKTPQLLKIQHLNTRIAALQDCILKTRLQPIRQMWQSLPRVAHDAAAALGKKIDLVMTGDDTELDRRVLDHLKEPFIHLIRNAADHGIETPEQRRQSGKPETGTIRLRAEQRGGQICLTIEDDGRGLNLDAIHARAVERGLAIGDSASVKDLIFAPGLSTAKYISNVSGRGVGLDVVRTQITKIGGSIDIDSKPGEFCRFIMTVPLTLAVVPVIMVGIGPQCFALPQDSVAELLRLPRQTTLLGKIGRQDTLLWRDVLLHVVHLSDVLRIASETETRDAFLSVVVLQFGSIIFALVVDRVAASENIIVKALPQALQGVGAYSGTTLRDDGTAALILHPAFLAQGALPERHVLPQTQLQVAS